MRVTTRGVRLTARAPLLVYVVAGWPADRWKLSLPYLCQSQNKDPGPPWGFTPGPEHFLQLTMRPALAPSQHVLHMYCTHLHILLPGPACELPLRLELSKLCSIIGVCRRHTQDTQGGSSRHHQVEHSSALYLQPSQTATAKPGCYSQPLQEQAQGSHSRPASGWYRAPMYSYSQANSMLL